LVGAVWAAAGAGAGTTEMNATTAKLTRKAICLFTK
jgi:hypothetical protein